VKSRHDRDSLPSMDIAAAVSAVELLANALNAHGSHARLVDLTDPATIHTSLAPADFDLMVQRVLAHPELTVPAHRPAEPPERSGRGRWAIHHQTCES
jgi:hypothetical protein